MFVYVCVCPAITLIFIDFLFGQQMRCPGGLSPRISVSQTDYFSITAVLAATMKVTVITWKQTTVTGEQNTFRNFVFRSPFFSISSPLFKSVSMVCIIPTSLSVVLKCQRRHGSPDLHG